MVTPVKLLSFAPSLGAVLALTVLALRADEPRNVLFIAVDDLRPELNCFGGEGIYSPNIDALAARGILFDRAYCQVAVCGASRASILTGLRPQTTRCWDFKTGMRAMNPDALSMPQYFKEKGYCTLSIGKIYHVSDDDFPQGWSEKPLRGMGQQYASEAANALAREAARIQRETGVRSGGPSHENPGEVDDDIYNDGQTAKAAIERLEGFAQSKEPFFIAVGFTKPHLPFNAPGKYWDLYDPAKIKVPSREGVINGLSYDGSTWGELKNYQDIPNKIKALDDETTVRLIHGYRAAVSYMDAQVGRLIASLDALGLAQNTTVVLWGDHGYYLGDFGEWCKHTTFEVATRVPLIIAAPGATSGQRSPAVVELVDVFPTLCELSGLAVPEGLHGVSLSPLLEDAATPWRAAAFSQFFKRKPEVGKVLGTSVRTDRYRYTEWRRKDQNGSLEDRTLIDFQKDPQALRNVANEPEYADALAELAKLTALSGTGLKEKSDKD